MYKTTVAMNLQIHSYVRNYICTYVHIYSTYCGDTGMYNTIGFKL